MPIHIWYKSYENWKKGKEPKLKTQGSEQHPQFKYTQENERLFRTAVWELDQVPVLSTATFNIITLANDPEVDIDRFSLAIETNQPVVLKLLAIANNAYFRSATQILTVKEAILRIGLGATKSLVITILLAENFKIEKNHPFDLHAHWLQSNLVAILCQELSQLNVHERRHTHTLYTIGLLHNLGVLIMCSLFPSEMGQLLSNVKPFDKDFTKKMMQLFSFNHYQAVSWLMKRWGLPDIFYKIIGNLSKPGQYEDEYGVDIQLIQKAERLSNHLIVEDLRLIDNDIIEQPLMDSDQLYDDIIEKTGHKLAQLKELTKSIG